MPSPQTGPTLLLLDDPLHPDHLVSRPCRRWDRMVARLHAPALDRRLAAGDRPESDRRMATRAQMLVSPDERRILAANWEHLLEVARRPPLRTLQRVPLARRNIAAADAAVREMLVALEAPFPVPARGVALARLLLSDGAGPLYRAPHSHGPLDEDQGAAALVSAVRTATTELDPTASLAVSA